MSHLCEATAAPLSPLYLFGMAFIPWIMVECSLPSVRQTDTANQLCAKSGRRKPVGGRHKEKTSHEESAEGPTSRSV